MTRTAKNRAVPVAGPSATGLTARQAEALQVIRDSCAQRGFGPTLREIADAMGIASCNGVVVHLRALEKKGFIQRSALLSRSIQLTPLGVGEADPVSVDNQAPSGIPLRGLVAAGQPVEANEQLETLELDRMFGCEGAWALRVSGDSMIDAQVADGDFVIVRPQATARSGQMAVIRTDQNETTLKYWFPEKKRIRLQPANAALAPVYVRSAEVLGVVIGVVRRVT